MKPKNTPTNKNATYSVCRTPSSPVIELVTPIYADKLAEKKRVGLKDAIAASNALFMLKFSEFGTTYV
jgi:hypothetical protein